VESQIKKEFLKVSPKKRFNQGDILKDLDVVIIDENGYSIKEYNVVEIHLSYGIIVSQDCDLEHDFNNREINNPLEPPLPNQKVEEKHDKYIPNILILPAYLAAYFKAGTHRGEDLIGETWNRDRYKEIVQNQNIRFHYIKAYPDLQIPELIIDFKHLYTIDRNAIYAIKDKVYLASIGEMFRESLSQRYCHYLSRIGLPEFPTT
jgi:hypothetical protein